MQFARIATNVATRQRFGRLAYPVAALEAVSAHKALEVELHFDGLFFPPAHQFRHRSTTASPTPINAGPALRCRAFQVTVINTPLFGGRWQFSIPEASFSDRLLDIVVIEERDIGEINRGLAHFFHPEERPWEQFARTHAPYQSRSPTELSGIPGIHHLQARGVTITTTRDPQDATIDGEVRGQTPMYAQIAHRQLQVVVPTVAGSY